MLASFRKGSHSFPAKILLVFLVLSFGLWGVGDVFRGGGDNVLAAVGKETITTQELDSTIRNAQSQFPELSGEVAQSLPVRLQFLQRLINSRLLEQEANSLGIDFSADALSERIGKDPAFLDANGQFSRDRFLGLLRQSNQSQGVFMQRFATDMKIGLLHGVITQSIMITPELARLYYHIQNETREASLIVLNAKNTPKTAPASDEELQALYGKIREQFREPEYRTYRFVYFNSDMIAKSLSADLDAAALQAYYEQHGGEYLDEAGAQMPFKKAKPLIKQFLSEQIASDKLIELSGQLDDAIAGGSTLEEALKGAGLTHLKVEALGPISAGGALKNGEIYDMSPVEEEMLRSAFEQDTGDISPITISADHYYYLVETLEVAPSFVPEFEAVQKDLAAILADERARQALHDKTDALAKELQEAENPLSAAKERNLSLLKTGIIARKTALIKQRKQQDLALNRAFIDTLFQLRLNEVSDAVSLGQDQSALIVLTAIHDSEEPDAKALENIRTQLKQQLGEQALDAYLTALREKYNVTLFMDKIVSQTQSDR